MKKGVSIASIVCATFICPGLTVWAQDDGEMIFQRSIVVNTTDWALASHDCSQNDAVFARNSRNDAGMQFLACNSSSAATGKSSSVHAGRCAELRCEDFIT